MWYKVFSIVLILLVALCLFTNKFIEGYLDIDLEVQGEDVDLDYLIDDEVMKNKCGSAKVHPNDVIITNIVDFVHRKDLSFVGISAEKRKYMILSKDVQVRYVHMIPNDADVAYVHPSDQVFFKRLFDKVYKKTSINLVDVREEKVYVSDFCDSLDHSDNMFIDFMESSHDFFVFSINSSLNTLLYQYFIDYFSSRVTLMNYVHDDHPNHIRNIHNFFYNSFVQPFTIINMDEVICARKNNIVDYDKLINNNYLDFKSTQLYLDLYYCNVPKEIQDQLDDVNNKLENNNIMDIKVDNIKGTTDSCAPDTKIVNNDNSPHNRYGIHTYQSKRCSSPTNLFIDIIFPFSNDYEIKLSKEDFNTLTIQKNTFDDIIPIKNAFKNNNKSIPRYKINVNPKLYPNHAFIDDIYYGSYADAKGVSILTNSIPFELDETKHDIVIDKDTVIRKISIYQKDIIKGSSYLIAPYTYGSTSMEVKIYEGDRCYIQPDSIFNDEMTQFIETKAQKGENWSYGYVRRDVLVNNNSVLYIELGDIRSTDYVNISGKCFDKDLQDTNKKESDCIEKDTTWEFPCKYNYECPFFESNKNYKNHFGGCQVDGTCQMPRGIHSRSFKKYAINDESAPLCYNCSLSAKDDKACCDEHKSNKHLVSPDYMFEEDTSERVRQIFMEEDSRKCSLLVNKYV